MEPAAVQRVSLNWRFTPVSDAQGCVSETYYTQRLRKSVPQKRVHFESHPSDWESYLSGQHRLAST